MADINERVGKLAQEVADLEELLGPDDVKVSFKLDEYAACLREANRLLEAKNVEARAKALRKKLYSQEVDNKHSDDALAKGSKTYKATNPMQIRLFILAMFLGVAGFLFWGQQSFQQARQASDPANGFRQKTFHFSGTDGFVVNLSAVEGPVETRDNDEGGYTFVQVPTKNLTMIVEPLPGAKKFGSRSQEFLSYYQSHELTLRFGLSFMFVPVKLTQEDGRFAVYENVAIEPDSGKRPFLNGGPWQIIWDGSPPYKPPEN